MLKKIRSLIVAGAVAVALVPAFAAESTAQEAIDPTWAEQFHGSWQFTMDTPGGQQPNTITVAPAESGVTIQFASDGEMPAPQFAGATRKDDTLVGSFNLGFDGMEFPLTINLKRDGEGMDAQWVFGDGEFQMEAKGTRQ